MAALRPATLKRIARTCITAIRPSIFLAGSACHDLQRITRQGLLQGCSSVPRRAHPDIMFLGGTKDHRHRLLMSRLHDSIGRACQEGIDQVLAVDRVWFSARL